MGWYGTQDPQLMWLETVHFPYALEYEKSLMSDYGESCKEPMKKKYPPLYHMCIKIEGTVESNRSRR